MAPQPSAPSGLDSSITSSSSTGLHRSCTFCRARKIRCSSGPICSACRERNINCIYSPEARKGRPRRRGTSVSDSHRQCPRRRRVSSPPAQPSPVSASSTAPHELSRSPPASPQLADNGRGGTDTSNAQAKKGDQENPTLGRELDRMFQEYFISKTGSRSNLFQNSIASFHRHIRKPTPGHTPAPTPRPKLSYDSLLSFLAHEMVEVLLLRFGAFGDEQLQSNPHQYFYITSLADETTPSMFDPPRRQKSPLAALGKHRVVQMVHFWFFMHPLSAVVSKTLLLSAIQDETVDTALLAIILADAFESFDPKDNPNTTGSVRPEESPQELLQFAASQLQHRPCSNVDAGPISTAQALILLGWREMSQGNARRATCYIGYTCRVVAREHQRRSRDEGDRERMKLNGTDIGEVEQEILRNIYWLCLSTTTWAFMQIDQPFTLLVPDEIPDFPSLDETTSAVLCLDRASNNISTLPSQVQAMRWLWPLSHVTSTVAHIYTLYLNAPTEESKVHAAPWHTRHIYQLHRLLRSRFHPSNLSLEIHGILIQAIQLVEREVTIPSTKSFLLTSYYTIIVHILFSPERRAPTPITPAIIQALGECISAILTIAARVPSLPTSQVPAQSSYATRTLAVSLDSCSHALVRLHSQYDWQLKEHRDTAPALTKLADYADQAHQVCRSDFLGNYASVLRPAKKRLKWVKSALRALCMSPSSQPVSMSEVTDAANAAFPSLSPKKTPFSLDRPGDLSLGSSACSIHDFIPQSPGFPPSQLVPPLEIPDPGFFSDNSSFESLLGFPGMARSDIYSRTSNSPSSHLTMGTLDGQAFGNLFLMSPDISAPDVDSMLQSNPFDTSNPVSNSGAERVCGTGAGLLGRSTGAQYDSHLHMDASKPFPAWNPGIAEEYGKYGE